MARNEVATQETMSIGDLPKRGQELIERLGITLGDPAEVQWRIAEQISLAMTPEELFDAGGTLGLREHMGEKFYVKSVDFLPSTKKGNPFFAVIQAMTPDGEARVYTSSATSVIIQLARGMQIEAFKDRPVYADWSTSEANADGNRPYKLFQA